MTFPRNVGQIPIYYNDYATGRFTNKDNNVFWSHYSDVEKTPLYPFGFGLSYTSFEYSNLKINKKSFAKGESAQVSVTLKNTGKYEGKEVVQLYIRDEFASVVRPVKELKGFQLVNLKPGETKTLSFTLTDRELGFYNNNGDFVVEPGSFKIMLGGSSDAKLAEEFVVM